MTTHRRAWALRVGVVVALGAGTLGLAVPAYAAGPIAVAITQTPGDLNPGESEPLYVQVTNNEIGAQPYTINVMLGGLGGDLTVGMPNGCAQATATSCTYQFTPGNGTTKNLVFTLKANSTVNVAAGSSKTVTVTVTAADGTASDSSSRSFKLNGPAAAASPTANTNAVTSIAGTVKDIQTGAVIPGALVELQDGANVRWQATSNSRGQFSFKSSGTRSIAPGQMVIGATKDGYTTFTRSFNASAGQVLTVAPLAMTPAAASAAAATGAAVPDSPMNAPADPNQVSAVAATGGGGGGFSTILIIVGAILVLAGVGAIVLILLRRKDEGTEPGRGGPGGEPGPDQGGPMPVPVGAASPGAYRGGPADPTMVAHNDPTRVTRAMSPDAPTEMLQRPAVDPFPPPDPYGLPPVPPDPYGAPAPPRSPQPAYQTGGYGQGYQPSYDEAPTYHPEQAYHEQPGPARGYGGGYGDGGYGNGYGSGYGPESTMPAPAPSPASPPPAPPLGQAQGPGYGVPPRPPAPADPYAAPAAGREYGGRGGYAAEQPSTRAYPGPVAGRGREEATGLYENYNQTYEQSRGGEGGYGAPGGGYQSGGYQPGGGGAGGAYQSGGQGYGGGAGYGGGQDDYPPMPRAGGYEPTRAAAAYDQPAAGYGSAPQAGYPQAGAYEQRDAYGSEYGSPGQSRHAAPPPPESSGYPEAGAHGGRSDQRRSLDWLDD